MTLQEFSDQYDTLLNSYAHKADLGDSFSVQDLVLDEYEKSVFLTKSQESIVHALYSGASGRGFEETEEVRRYLSPLVDEGTLTPDTDSSLQGMGSSSTFFTLPDGLWVITYESVNVDKGDCGEMALDVAPVTQDEYSKLKKNPFRGATSRRALRLDLSDNTVEIVCNYPVSSYYLRYLKRPEPIILCDLPDGLEIDGKSEENDCKLPESLHDRILEGAVALTIQSRFQGQQQTNKSSDR